MKQAGFIFIWVLIAPVLARGQEIPCNTHNYEGYIPFCSAAWERSGEDSWVRYIDIEETQRDVYAEVTLNIKTNVIQYHITVQCVKEDDDGYEVGIREGVFGYSSWTKGDLTRDSEHCPGEITFVDSPPELIRTAEEFIGLPDELL